jgi:hypothetical protein
MSELLTAMGKSYAFANETSEMTEAQIFEMFAPKS